MDKTKLLNDLNIELSIKEQNEELQIFDDDNLERIDQLIVSINKLTKEINHVR